MLVVFILLIRKMWFFICFGLGNVHCGQLSYHSRSTLRLSSVNYLCRLVDLIINLTAFLVRIDHCCIHLFAVLVFPNSLDCVGFIRAEESIISASLNNRSYHCASLN